MGSFIGFFIWTLVSISLAGIGVYSFKAKKAVGFWAGVEPPKVKDVKKYNHTIGILWFIYATLMELTGLPLIFIEQNSAAFVPVILCPMAITIGMMVAYYKIEKINKI
ncbi:MAG: hypothetical protein IKN47_05725 [Lachnospiraceae bacterium]|nr:hypothetical protein [Lachnospiraceae bacterium]